MPRNWATFERRPGDTEVVLKPIEVEGNRRIDTKERERGKSHHLGPGIVKYTEDGVSGRSRLAVGSPSPADLTCEVTRHSTTALDGKKKRRSPSSGQLVSKLNSDQLISTNIK